MDATLKATVLGALIATIPLLLGLIVQIILHISENRQKKKEAKTQLALELMRNDVKIIEDSIDNELKSIMLLLSAAKRRVIEGESEYQLNDEFFFNPDSMYAKLREMSDIADKLACSLGKEFYSEYQKFDKLEGEFTQMCLSDNLTDFASWEKMLEMNSGMRKIAASLHTKLKDKLISIRDTA